jgi:protein TonB
VPPGLAPNAGVALIEGPGTGTGGEGVGTGAGGYGSGTGGGGVARRARLISGFVDDRDYPRAAIEDRASGTVFLRFVVAPNGRVSQCSITRSSGHPALDATTCRLIMRRFRYLPARDRFGRPVAETVNGDHDWRYTVGPDREIEPTIPDDE